MFVCKKCNYTSISKLWKCPECNEFWSFEESIEKKENDKIIKWNVLKSNLHKKNIFFDIQNDELKRVFTNWIKSSGIYLLWWQPWIWKSTLVLQIVQALQDGLKVAYFSWEEESSAIIWRYNRLFWENPNFEIYHSMVLEDIISTIEEKKLDIFILDSIQTVYSQQIWQNAGTINQVKYCSEKLSLISKNIWSSCIIIWHITKSWEIAWPKYLEHIVDVVAYLEWDRLNEYRFLRTYKNRFGGTDDIAIFQMQQNWLKAVYNLKDTIKQNFIDTPWSAFTIWIDNGRAVLTNIEVLLNKTKYKFPKRSTIWVDNSRVEMVIAILEKYLKINLDMFDIFINIPWEFKFYDSGLDLAIAVWIYSAYKEQSIWANSIFIWEISLSGKISKSSFHEKREKESLDFDLVDFKSINNIKDLQKLF
jgi:DNA repair protein RadA/Sms